MDKDEVFGLAECTAPSEGQALNPVNAGQSNVQCIGDLGRGTTTDGMENDKVFLVAEYIAPSKGQALNPANARQSNVQCIGDSGRGL